MHSERDQERDEAAARRYEDRLVDDQRMREDERTDR